MRKCPKCGAPYTIPAEARPAIREFKSKYPWVTNVDLAKIFGVSKVRIGEIINANETKGGK